MKITVTQEDIDNSTPGKFPCPIERAIIRETAIINVSVGDGDIEFAMKRIEVMDTWGKTRNGLLLTRWESFFIQTPVKVANFIHKFDLDKTVKPFTFNLR